MLYPNPPADADVTAFLQNSSISLPSGYSADGFAAAALSEWQVLTGFTPFQATGIDSERSFDPPGPVVNSKSFVVQMGGGRIMPLKGGLVTVTSVVTGSGNQVLGTNYRLRPGNFVALGVPAQWIEFFAPIYGQADSVVVTGDWGYCLEFPEFAWQAILRLAACMAADDTLADLLTQPSLEKVGDVQVSQASDREDPAIGWMKYVNRAVAHYKLKIGLIR